MMNTPLKTPCMPHVVMVISQYYPLRGGAELQAQRLAASLKQKGVKLFILTQRMKKHPTHEALDGIPVYRSIRTVGLPVLWGLFYIASVGLFLYRKRHSYTIIHCHILQEYQSAVAIIFKYLFNKKVIAKMSSSGITSDLNLMKHGFAGRITLRLLRYADKIVSVSSRSTAELIQCGFPSDMVVEIPNGVDTDVFTGNAPGRESKQKTITFIGRLDRFKGVEYLLAAFKQVVCAGADVMLKLVGNGILEDELRNRAAALAIEQRVIFRGRQEDIAGELSGTDIFVLPSLSEGMSNALLEAMSCGLPVVATAVGGANDMISNRLNGLLVPPGDPEALTSALFELLHDAALGQRLGAEARKTVERRYDLSRITDCYLGLYNSLSL